MTDGPMDRVALAVVEMLNGMIDARHEVGMTDPDEIGASIMESLKRMTNEKTGA